MVSANSWDVSPCKLVQIYQGFGGMYCLHLGQRVRQANNWQAYHPAGLVYILTLKTGGGTFL
jgi:hypothetical protein